MYYPTSEEGQGLMEYALVLVLIAVVVITIVTVFGSEVQALYQIVTALGPLN